MDGLDTPFLGRSKQVSCSCRHICSVSVPASKARCVIILTLGELALSSMQRSRILLGHVRQLGLTAQSSRSNESSCPLLKPLPICWAMPPIRLYHGISYYATKVLSRSGQLRLANFINAISHEPSAAGTDSPMVTSKTGHTHCGAPDLCVSH